MKLSEDEKKAIRSLSALYFKVCPNVSRNIAFKTKAFDMITAYYTKHGKTYDEIKHCIESNPNSTEPIWDILYNYFFKAKPKSNSYSKKIEKSLDPKEWM